MAETGSRGGLDVAAAAQPGDGAKRLLNFEDDSSSSFDERMQGNRGDEDSSTWTTDTFNFNLNAMKVSSTPKKNVGAVVEIRKETNQQQSAIGKEAEVANKMLSTILEETKSYG